MKQVKRILILCICCLVMMGCGGSLEETSATILAAEAEIAAKTEQEEVVLEEAVAIEEVVIQEKMELGIEEMDADEVTQDGLEAETSDAIEVEEIPEEVIEVPVIPETTEPEETIDTTSDFVDLTIHSNTMLLAELSNMAYRSENYIGKTVRMTGEYDAYVNRVTEEAYHFVAIWDATACCQAGLEFSLMNGQYPEIGDTITIEGVFTEYAEDGYLYYILANAKIVG
ncbi:hypothetical protein [Chakrabartyella piscis]|uniref:hypothetical protein n=1 Tax=Chakrabartyella piscis TaxID=2918914 RepID=UPI002958AD3B|nr:hypothetical protein [Chakrabartyella piscis]